MQVEEEFLTYLDIGSIGQLGVRRDGFSVKDIGGIRITITSKCVVYLWTSSRTKIRSIWNNSESYGKVAFVQLAYFNA